MLVVLVIVLLLVFDSISISITSTSKSKGDLRQRTVCGRVCPRANARVVEWQTRTFEGRMPKGMRVQVPPRAPCPAPLDNCPKPQIKPSLHPVRRPNGQMIPKRATENTVLMPSMRMSAKRRINQSVSSVHGRPRQKMRRYAQAGAKMKPRTPINRRSWMLRVSWLTAGASASNETELSHRWRERARQKLRTVS